LPLANTPTPATMPTMDVNELIRTFSDDSTDSSGSNWVHISRLNRSEYSPEIGIFDDDETVGTPTAIVEPVDIVDFINSDSDESSVIPPAAFPPKSAFLDLELIDIESMKLISADIKPHIFVSDQPFVAAYKTPPMEKDDKRRRAMVLPLYIDDEHNRKVETDITIKAKV
jgi:hypothetical protein